MMHQQSLPARIGVWLFVYLFRVVFLTLTVLERISGR